MEEKTVSARLTFVGEARRIPEINEPVVLHVANGSWRSGFRCISNPEDGRVWVATEGEFQNARKEDRYPAGDTWPLDQLAGTGS